MKALMNVVALASLVFMTSVSAYARTTTLIVCQDLHPVNDRAYSVVVTQSSADCHLGQACPQYVLSPAAQIVESGLAGPMTIGGYSVFLFPGSPNRPGSPHVVRASNPHSFSLEISAGTAPLPQGGIYSRLSAETSQGRVVVEMACKFTGAAPVTASARK